MSPAVPRCYKDKSLSFPGPFQAVSKPTASQPLLSRIQMLNDYESNRSKSAPCYTQSPATTVGVQRESGNSHSARRGSLLPSVHTPDVLFPLLGGQDGCNCSGKCPAPFKVVSLFASFSSGSCYSSEKKKPINSLNDSTESCLYLYFQWTVGENQSTYLTVDKQGHLCWKG